METYVEELRIWKPSILPLAWNLQRMAKLPCPWCFVLRHEIVGNTMEAQTPSPCLEYVKYGQAFLPIIWLVQGHEIVGNTIMEAHAEYGQVVPIIWLFMWHNSVGILLQVQRSFLFLPVIQFLTVIQFAPSPLPWVCPVTQHCWE